MSGRFEFRDTFMMLLVGIFFLLAAALLYGKGHITDLIAFGCIAFGLLSLIAFFIMLTSGGE